MRNTLRETKRTNLDGMTHSLRNIPNSYIMNTNINTLISEAYGKYNKFINLQKTLRLRKDDDLTKIKNALELFENYENNLSVILNLFRGSIRMYNSNNATIKIDNGILYINGDKIDYSNYESVTLSGDTIPLHIFKQANRIIKKETINL